MKSLTYWRNHEAASKNRAQYSGHWQRLDLIFSFQGHMRYHAAITVRERHYGGASSRPLKSSARHTDYIKAVKMSGIVGLLPRSAQRVRLLRR